MPRRRKSKASRAIRAAVFKENKVRRQEANALHRQQAAAALALQTAPVIAPERLAADIQLGEEILRAVQAQRRIIPQYLIPPLGVLVATSTPPTPTGTNRRRSSSGSSRRRRS